MFEYFPDDGLPAPALPARVAAPAPVKVLPQVWVSAVLERVSAGQPGHQLSSQICGLLGKTRPKSQKMQQSWSITSSNAQHHILKLDYKLKTKFSQFF